MSMDFGRMGFSRIEGDFNDVNNPSNQQRNLLIEVVVIDLTRPTKTLYQFNKETPFTEEELKSIKRDSTTISHDAFTPVGEVESIDKATKTIILANRNTVTYKHLITVTGKQATIISYEFLAGLYTLVEALRVNKTVGEHLIPSHITKLKTNFNIKVYDDHNEKIDKLGTHSLPRKRPEQATVLVSELNKKLFEVQI